MTTDPATRPSDLDPDVARWLITDGLDDVARATARLDDGDDLLALGTALRAEGLDLDHAAAVAEAAVARRRARGGWQDADQLLFTRRGLEQASHPAVSAWRARRFSGARCVVDLCSGIGGDTLALAGAAGQVVAVDHDVSRVLLLRHNARVRGLPVHGVVGTATDPPLRALELIHVDPGRRVGERRVRHLAEYLPPVPALRPMLERARGAAVILSPALDLDDPDVPNGELEFVQVGGDLLEAVLWTGELAGPTVRSATVLNGTPVHLAASDERELLPTGDVGEWLVEPAPAAVRARVHDQLGREIGARRLAQRRALLTTDTDPGVSPWWRASRVEAVLPLRSRTVRSWLRDRPHAPLELVLHGADIDVSEWWRAIGAPQRSWGGRVLHLVRLDQGGICVVTRLRESATATERSGGMVPPNGAER